MSLASRLAHLGPGQTPAERARTVHEDFYGSLNTSKTDVAEGVWPTACEWPCPDCQVSSSRARCFRCGADLSTAGPVPAPVAGSAAAPVSVAPRLPDGSSGRGGSRVADGPARPRVVGTSSGPGRGEHGRPGSDNTVGGV